MELLSSLVSGAFHGITGPDHLTAVLPLCVNQGFKAWKIGFLWGLGHGIGMVLFGVLAYLIKMVVPVDIEAWAETLQAIVGLSLIIIGIMGVKEVREEMGDKDSHNHNHSAKADLSLVTGIWQGFTGSGHFVGVMPALTLPSLFEAVLYLSVYCFGTMVAMALFSGIVGATSRRLSSESLDPLNIAFSASCFSMAVGTMMVLYEIFNERISFLILLIPLSYIAYLIVVPSMLKK